MKEFDIWKREVLRRVRFAPDRAAIAAELSDHYEDSVKDLERIGYGEALAHERALAFMGDAEEVGAAMDKAHSPFLGWVWYVSRWASIALMAALALWFWADFGVNIENDLRNRMESITARDDYRQATMEEGMPELYGYFELTLMTESRGGSIEKAGHTISIPYAAMYQVEDWEEYILVLLLRVEDDRFWNDTPYAAIRNLSMTDSDGRKFSSYETYGDLESTEQFNREWDGHVQLWGSNGNRLAMDCFLEVNGFESIPKWTDLTCEMDEGFTLRIEWEVEE